MTADDALRWTTLALCAASAMLAHGAVRRSAALQAVWARHVARLEGELRFQGVPLTGQRLAKLQAIACATLATSALALDEPMVLVFLVIGACAPTLVLRRMRVRRIERIEAQLDGFLLALAHSLKATPALGDGLRSSADVVAAPLADELRLLLRENELGAPLDRALESMASRVRSPVVSAALSALRIGRSSGGDFVHTLERSAATLREMARLEGVVRTKTAEGRAQTVVVSALPIPTLYLFHRISPAMLEPLWTTDAGHVLLAVALVIWAVAFAAARRIAQVDI